MSELWDSHTQDYKLQPLLSHCVICFVLKFKFGNWQNIIVILIVIFNTFRASFLLGREVARLACNLFTLSVRFSLLALTVGSTHWLVQTVRRWRRWWQEQQRQQQWRRWWWWWWGKKSKFFSACCLAAAHGRTNFTQWTRPLILRIFFSGFA